MRGNTMTFRTRSGSTIVATRVDHFTYDVQVKNAKGDTIASLRLPAEDVFELEASA